LKFGTRFWNTSRVNSQFALPHQKKIEKHYQTVLIRFCCINRVVFYQQGTTFYTKFVRLSEQYCFETCPRGPLFISYKWLNIVLLINNLEYLSGPFPDTWKIRLFITYERCEVVRNGVPSSHFPSNFQTSLPIDLSSSALMCPPK